MRDHDDSASEQTQGDQPLRSIPKTFIHECDAWAVEYQGGILERQTVLGKVAAVLRFVPFVFRLQCSSFCNYRLSPPSKRRLPGLFTGGMVDISPGFLKRQ